MDVPRFRIQVKAIIFSLLQNFQTGSVAHTAARLVRPFPLHRG